MYKIKDITFVAHPILGDLHLDFCDLSGRAVDTVIIAGENGTGKSTILNALYSAICFNLRCNLRMKIENNGEVKELRYSWSEEYKSYMLNGQVQGASRVDQYPFHALFSDVDINFKSNAIQMVKSSDLDWNSSNQRSTPDLPTEIKQLIVDIQASDAADTDESYRTMIARGAGIEDIVPGKRIQRFTTAFNQMFDNLTYSRVTNKDNHKAIVFSKNGKDIEIDGLSSGEKQIVFRGCFLLKDKNALNGAFVFIDEPEISLHPEWQKKILDYYKGIFTNEEGAQTSQLFVVTHSPFVIHNEHRKNDKVIVLQRDETGKITVLDKPEYYSCESTAPIRDAYNIDDFSADTGKSIVYLEGRTDELYFKKAQEVFGYTDVPFEFQWIGHLTKQGKEEFTGQSNMDHAVNFIKGRSPEIPQVFLYDCDTQKAESDENNIIVMTMPFYDERVIMKKGIENALELEGINLEDFYTYHKNQQHYGEETIKKQFEKIKLCEHICGLEKERQQKILGNLKPVIEKIMNRITAS